MFINFLYITARFSNLYSQEELRKEEIICYISAHWVSGLKHVEAIDVL